MTAPTESPAAMLERLHEHCILRIIENEPNVGGSGICVVIHEQSYSDMLRLLEHQQRVIKRTRETLEKINRETEVIEVGCLLESYHTSLMGQRARQS
jgi:hypothetical protein